MTQTPDHDLALTRAQDLIALNRDTDAMRLLTGLLADFPEAQGPTLTTMTVAHSVAGRPTEGIRTARASLALMPDSPAGHYLLGSLLRRIGKTREALASLDRALALDPHAPAVHQQRAQVLADLHRWPEARVAAEEALALAPDQADAHFTMGYVLHHINLPLASTAYRNALAVDPHHVESLHNLGVLGVQRGDYAAGTRGLAEALTQSPGLGVSIGMLDAVILGIVRRLHLATFASVFGLRVVAGALSGSAAWFAPAAWVALLLVAFWIVRRGLAPVRTELPHRGEGFLRGFARREKLGVAWMGTILIAWLVTGIGAIGQAMGLAAKGVDGAVGFAIVALVVGVVLTWVRAPIANRRLRRDRFV